MRILIDIGHPAHIHYFKNLAKIMAVKGHVFHFIIRERSCISTLIDSTGFRYSSRGKGGGNFLSKALLLPRMDYRVYKVAKLFNPDIFVSFASPYAAHISALLKKPHIAFDDTEYSFLSHILYRPFCNVILSPSCYYGALNKKQILFNSYMELSYLHPNYFTPDQTIFSELGLNKGDKYCILRFVSWDAFHDIGQKGLNYSTKLNLIKELSKYCKVFISSEDPLPNEFIDYKLNLHPTRFHDALYYASLYIGEGSTTASEASVLGTPAIYTNTLILGYCKELQEKYGLLFQFQINNGVLEKAIDILTDINSPSKFENKREIMLSNKIDPTAFFIWFIENYPTSVKVMKENPDYQYRFK